MSKTRNLSDLLDANGDVKTDALDNVPPSNDASALTTGTLPNDRLSAVPNSALANSSITINGSATSLGGSATINTDVVNDTTPQLGGDLASNGNDILMADNDKIKLGTGNDLEIYHDGSNSYVKDTGTGDLYLQGSTYTVLGSTNGENGVIVTENGSTQLRYDNSNKLATSSSGVTVTGTLTTTSSDFRTAIFQRSGSGAFISLNDNTTSATDAVLVGATGDDLVFHTGNSETARLNSSGTLTATAFSGDGSGLTNVPAGVSNVNMVVFTSSGTYTPTSGTKFATVYATGGGGGGGSADWNVNETYVRNAGAGGGGGTAIRSYNATELGANASITIGGGGGGGGTGGNGSSGGSTSFNPAGTGSTITGNGGGGGTSCWNSSNTHASGLQGTGGDASGGQVNINGEIGQNSGGKDCGLVIYSFNNSDTRVQANYGGSTFFSASGHRQVNRNATNGGNAIGYGVGGNGAHGFQSNYSNRSGGSGASGIVVIMEYA